MQNYSLRHSIISPTHNFILLSDDPYYHGLSARVTAFTHKNREKNFSR